MTVETDVAVLVRVAVSFGPPGFGKVIMVKLSASERTSIAPIAIAIFVDRINSISLLFFFQVLWIACSVTTELNSSRLDQLIKL